MLENGARDWYCSIGSFNPRHAEPGAKLNVVWRDFAWPSDPDEDMIISATFTWMYAQWVRWYLRVCFSRRGCPHVIKDCRDDAKVLTVVNLVQAKSSGVYALFNDVMKQFLGDSTLQHEDGKSSCWEWWNQWWWVSWYWPLLIVILTEPWMLINDLWTRKDSVVGGSELDTVLTAICMTPASKMLISL